MYQQMIQEELARQGQIGVSPIHVEAWMRLGPTTLDELDSAGFAWEVAVAVKCIAADPVASQRLAEFLGLR